MNCPRLVSGSCNNGATRSAGDHMNQSEPNTTSMVPTQKSGSAIPAVAATRAQWSPSVSCRIAEYTPIGIATRVVSMVASITSSTVTGMRRMISADTFSLDHREVPRSPRSTRSPIQRRYWTCSGWSRPSARMMFARSISV